VKLTIKPHKARIEIIPLIDVIFFCLTFFMVYGTLETQSSAMKIDLPKTVHVGDPANTTLIVSIRNDETIWLGDNQTSLDELPGKIQTELQQDPETMVVLHPERKVPYDRLVSVMDCLAQVGVNHPLLGGERKKLTEE